MFELLISNALLIKLRVGDPLPPLLNYLSCFQFNHVQRCRLDNASTYIHTDTQNFGTQNFVFQFLGPQLMIDFSCFIRQNGENKGEKK